MRKIFVGKESGRGNAIHVIQIQKGGFPKRVGGRREMDFGRRKRILAERTVFNLCFWEGVNILCFAL